MKKFIAATVLMFASAMAFAMPSPKQIEQALVMDDANSARSMVSEVLREKPDSPKAHLFNSYILVHYDKNKVAASEELKNVVRLDKKGDVKGSALFGKVVGEIEAPVAVKQAPRQVVQPVSYKQPTVYKEPTTDNSKTIVIILLIVGVGLVVLVYLSHRQQRQDYARTVVQYVPAASSDNYVAPASGYRSRHVETHPVPYDSPVHVVHNSQPVYQAPVQQNQPMGALGTAASVAGGVVAGNMISDMLHNGGHHHSHGGYRSSSFDDYEETRRRRDSSYDSTPAYVAPAYEAPVKVDYESRSSSFSSGSDNSWGSSSSSSSSSDYSSSSSSDSGWSDSGSSGGGDW